MAVGVEELKRMVVRLVGDGTSYQQMLQQAQEATKTVAAAVQEASSKIEGISKGLEGFAGSALKVLGVFGATTSLEKMFTKSVDLERTMVKLSAAIESNGRAAGPAIAQYTEFAARVGEVTLLSKMQTFALIQSAEGMGFSGKQAEGVVTRAIALAKGNGDLAQSFIRVSAMMERGHPEMAKRILGLQGVTDKSQLMTDINKKLEQGLKVAAADANTLGGQIEKLKRSFAALTSDVGDMLTTAARPVIKWLTEAMDWFRALDPQVKRTTGIVVGLVGALMTMGPLWGLLAPFRALLMGPINMLTGFLTGLPTLWSFIGGAVSVVVSAVQALGGAVLFLLNPMNLLRGAFTILTTLAGGLAGILGVVFSPVTLLVVGAAAAVSLFVDSMGGVGDAWEAVKQGAVDAWNYAKTKTMEFVVWVRPITQALGSFFTTAWRTIKDGVMWLWEGVRSVFTSIYQYADSVWKAIAGSALPTWAQIRDAIRDAILFAEFTLRNFWMVAELVWMGIKLGFVRLINVITFFFTDTVPALLKWFANNWQEIFKATWDYVVAGMGKMWDIIVKIFNSVPWGKLWESFKNSVKWAAENAASVFASVSEMAYGGIQFSDIWQEEAEKSKKKVKKSLNGMKDIVDEANKGIKPLILPQRVMGPLEAELQAEYDKQKDKVNQSFEEFKKQKLKEFEEANKPLNIEPALKKQIDEALKLPPLLSAGVAKEAHKIDAALSGSAEAVARAAHFRDTLRDFNKPGTEPVPKDGAKDGYDYGAAWAEAARKAIAISKTVVGEFFLKDYTSDETKAWVQSVTQPLQGLLNQFLPAAPSPDERTLSSTTLGGIRLADAQGGQQGVWSTMSDRAVELLAQIASNTKDDENAGNKNLSTGVEIGWVSLGD